MARPARAARPTIRNCGNGPDPSLVPAVPNAARFAGVSARLTSIPSAAHTLIPASRTAPGPSSTSGPAARQNSDSSSPAGTSRRQSVITFSVGTCHSRANGTSASNPTSLTSASQ